MPKQAFNPNLPSPLMRPITAEDLRLGDRAPGCAEVVSLLKFPETETVSVWFEEPNGDHFHRSWPYDQALCILNV